MSSDADHVMPPFPNRQDATAYADHVLANHHGFTYELATRSRHGDWHIMRTGRPVVEVLAARAAVLAAGPEQMAA